MIIFQIEFVENIKTHGSCSVILFPRKPCQVM